MQIRAQPWDELPASHDQVAKLLLLQAKLGWPSSSSDEDLERVREQQSREATAYLMTTVVEAAAPADGRCEWGCVKEGR